MGASFIHRFGDMHAAPARRWSNPDGSKGGIVALDAIIHESAVIAASAVVWPRAFVGARVSIGGGASIGYRASIGDRASIGYRGSIGEGVEITSDDWHFSLGPQGSRNALATAVHSRNHGLRWWVGCQHRITTDQLVARVRREHRGAEHETNYLYAIRCVTEHPELLARIAEARAAKEQA